KLEAVQDFAPPGVASLNVRKGRHLDVQVFAVDAGVHRPLRLATKLPGFSGTQEAVFILPERLQAGDALYVRVHAIGEGAEELSFAASTLDGTLASGAERARMIALTFGALFAMAIAALLIWFILEGRLLLLYAALFSLQALYVAYLSGQGFDWPVLRLALPFMSHAWNVPAALSGAAACLFVREIAELQRYSPRVYRIFGWLAVTFVALAFAN